MTEVNFLTVAGIVLISVAILIIFGILLRKWCQGGKYRKNTRIDGKIVIITGANSGLGKESAIDLAKRGGKIYMACRDVRRGEDALNEVKERSKSNDVYFMQLDLASLKSIRDFAKNFHARENRLDILMNNAGIMACPRMVTEDGFEMQIGVNHLGHFLLTNLLLDLLKASTPSRIINVSSICHLYGRIKKDDLNNERSYYPWLAYGQSKLANILFTRELTKRLAGSGVTANSLHPGLVKTELHKYMNPISRFLSFRDIIFKTPVNGAQTQIRLAVDPELENVSGKYFADCKPTFTCPAARDDEMAEWLWRKSEQLTHLESRN